MYGRPESLTRDEKFGEMCSMEFYQKILYLRVTPWALIALQKFYSDHCLKYFCKFPNNISFSFLLQKNKPTQSATIVITLWTIAQRTNWKVAFWFGAIARKGACTVISQSLARSVDIVAWPMQRRFAFCTSWKVSEVIQRLRRNDSPRKLMEEYWFLAPMSRLAISSASFEYFFSETLHDNLPVVRAKQLSWSMKKTTSCKKATELPG